MKWMKAMMGYACNFAGERHSMHREFGVKYHGRPRWCENKIEFCLREIGYEDGKLLELVQNCMQWQILVLRVLTLLVMKSK